MPAMVLLDTDTLDEMLAVLGPASVDRLVHSFLADLAGAPADIVRLFAANDPAAARSAAHRLRGAALGLGCTRLAHCALDIELGTDAATACTDALADAAGRTAAALRAHCAVAAR